MTTHGQPQHHVVIIGGGFGGLYAANRLGKHGVRVTLIDRRNFHLFQPLLYQVATGALAPSEVAYPLRAALRKHRNTHVLQAEVMDIDPDQQRVILRDGEVAYDSLIVATGSHHHYFGNDQWAEVAPGLKTMEDALEMRNRIFFAFEQAERETDPVARQAWLNFVVVGGGPTGVELAGAIGELAQNTLRRDFRAINPADAQILLLEGADRILPVYPPELSLKAEKALVQLGVTVRTGTLVTNIDAPTVTMKTGDHRETVEARTILWGAGMRASGMAKVLHERCGAAVDRAGRVLVNADTSLPNYPTIFAIGDMANYQHGSDKPLPGVATVAMQQGEYVAKLLQARIAGKPEPRFTFTDKGSLAVIGRNAAVADIGPFKFAGYFAWVVWLFIHIAYLVGFEQRLIVLTRWSWSYFTTNRGGRIIVGKNSVSAIEDFWERMGERRKQHAGVDPYAAHSNGAGEANGAAKDTGSLSELVREPLG